MMLVPIYLCTLLSTASCEQAVTLAHSLPLTGLMQDYVFTLQHPSMPPVPDEMMYLVKEVRLQGSSGISVQNTPITAIFLGWSAVAPGAHVASWECCLAFAFSCRWAPRDSHGIWASPVQGRRKQLCKRGASSRSAYHPM